MNRHCLSAVMGTLFACSVSCFAAGNIEKATSYTQVMPHGLYLDKVLVTLDKSVSIQQLVKGTFSVDGQTVTSATLVTSPDNFSAKNKSQYLLLTVDKNNPNAHLFVHKGDQLIRRSAAVVVREKDSVSDAGNTSIKSQEIVNPLVDKFTQHQFYDPKTKNYLPYNIYVPENYDANKQYPLVLFMHDASVLTTDTQTTLIQGQGAVAFSSERDQSKHPAIVIAPQYPIMTVNDDHQVSNLLDTTVHLIQKLQTEYNIDPNRLYNCGQSMGAMMSLVMDAKYDDMFAASLIVAGQWEPEVLKPLANDNLWVIVSQGDEKAYPGENAMMKTLKEHGASISKVVWDGQSSAAQFSELYKNMVAKKTAINYVALKKGTVVPQGLEDNGLNNHLNTWPIAYNIPELRDWLFEHKKN